MSTRPSHDRLSVCLSVCMSVLVLLFVSSAPAMHQPPSKSIPGNSSIIARVYYGK